MQLMIDLNEALQDSRRAEAAIVMLRTAADVLERSSIVRNSREDAPKTPDAPAAPQSKVVELFKKPTDAPQSATAKTAEVLPPPPPLMASSSGSTDAPPPPSSVSMAPAPSASSAPQTGNSTPSAIVEYDSAGVPFDGRIHQKARGKKTDGSWKLQKGIDQNLVQSVISELAAARKMAPLKPAAPSTNDSAKLDVPSPAASVGFGKAPLPAGADAPPPPPTANDAPPPPPNSDAMPTVTFREMVAKFAKATKDGKLTPQEVQGICQLHGAPTLMSLNAMAHLIPDVDATLDATLLMKG